MWHGPLRIKRDLTTHPNGQEICRRYQNRFEGRLCAMTEITGCTHLTTFPDAWCHSRHPAPQNHAPTWCSSTAHEALEVVTPDDSLLTALRRFGSSAADALPVVDTVEDRRVLGTLKRVDLFSEYERALTESHV